MKVESRGKFPGVKLHLEPEEITVLMDATHMWHPDDSTEELLGKMRKKIAKLQEENPNVLQARTPEEIQAILVKEVEKASMQLKAVLAGQDPAKIDKNALKAKLLTYVSDK